MMNLDPLVHIGALLLFGFAGGQIANHFKFPRVSGYIVTGMILSPSVTGFFQEKVVSEELSIITDIALGIIAFSIGGSLVLKSLKKLYGSILWINFMQSFGAFLVTALLICLVSPFIINSGIAPHAFWQTFFPMALIIGAVSAATAPAAVMAIVHECRAAGPLTTTLLAVVALDDATAIVFYSFSVVLASSLIDAEALSWGMMLSPILSILIALVIGIVSGLIFSKTARFVTRSDVMLGVVGGLILLIYGIANSAGVSPLIANMAFGFMVVNFVAHAHDIFDTVEGVEELIFSMFFVLAGAHLDIAVFSASGFLLAGLIILGNFTGKFYGTRLGAIISHAPGTVRQYLGFALLPKAGVTVGLILLAKDTFDSSPLSALMVNAVLLSVIINELIAPPLVRYALIRAGETGDE
jgi:Kef-type K+ transport system membrane component KefB